MACGGPNRRLECGEDEEEAEEDKETFTVFEGKPEELGKFLDEHKPSDPAWNTYVSFMSVRKTKLVAGPVNRARNCFIFFGFLCMFW